MRLLKKLRGLVRVGLERYEEWRFGIYTDGEVLIDQFGVTDPEYHCYGPTNYRRFRQVLRHAPTGPNDVFLDLGCGKGRVVIVAATRPFRRVIGVELIEEFCRIASRNLDKAKKRLRCKDVQIHKFDVRDYEIPTDVTVVYIWNAFGDNILKAALDNIRRSIAQAPRKITLLYLSPPEGSHLDNVRSGFPWLAETTRKSLGTHLLLSVCESRN